MVKRVRKADMSKAVGYIRVSTDEQALGPKAQRTAIERWAAAHGATVVAWHSDLGVSGGTPIDQRPGLLAALDALGVHSAGHLVVAKRDRLARDVLIAAMTEQLVRRRGAQITSAGNGAENGDAPEAQLMRSMIDAFAQFERALIRQRTKAALDQKRARGERVGSVPWGYQVASDGITLEPNTAEQETIAEARRLQDDGWSQREITRALNAGGRRSRAGGQLALSQVQRMLAA
jgi:site-specific DNA recombinase